MRAALLDFGGLILQTEASGFAALRAVFAARGVEYRLEEYIQIVATSNEVLAPSICSPEPHALTRRQHFSHGTRGVDSLTEIDLANPCL